MSSAAHQQALPQSPPDSVSPASPTVQSYPCRTGLETEAQNNRVTCPRSWSGQDAAGLKPLTPLLGAWGSSSGGSRQAPCLQTPRLGPSGDPRPRPCLSTLTGQHSGPCLGVLGNLGILPAKEKEMAGPGSCSCRGYWPTPDERGSRMRTEESERLAATPSTSGTQGGSGRGVFLCYRGRQGNSQACQPSRARRRPLGLPRGRRSQRCLVEAGVRLSRWPLTTVPGSRPHPPVPRVPWPQSPEASLVHSL